MTTYRIINVLFYIILGCVFLYSFIFYPNRQPVSCVYKNKTGVDCPSCGISRVFSLMVNGDFEAAIQTNKNALGLFLFFFIQWIWRGWVVFFYDKNKCLRSKITHMADAVATSVLFVISIAFLYNP